GGAEGANAENSAARGVLNSQKMPIIGRKKACCHSTRMRSPQPLRLRVSSGTLTSVEARPKFDHWTTMRIASKAPTRVDLAGSTLDIWPLYLFHPGAVTINAAITRYASCVIDQHAQGDDRIKLVSRDTQLEESFDSFA